jgi:outer membrane protein assembly factor BamD (BamD/ComL family)
MMRRLMFLLVVLIGPAVMGGHAFQVPPQSPEDYHSNWSKAQQALRELLQQYPDLAPTVQQFIKDMDENLALGDFKVGQFYASKGNHAGALSRLKIIIDKYPNFSRIDEVNQLYKTLSNTKQPSQSPQGNAK